MANPDFHPWYYQNYVQIAARPWQRTAQNGAVTDELWVDFVLPGGYSDLLYEAFYAHRYIPDILDFIHSSLNDHIYVSVDLDEFFLPFKPYYQQVHFVHPMMIYGYDQEKREFQCIGMDRKNAFSRCVLRYDDFLPAYTAMTRILDAENRDITASFPGEVTTYRRRRTFANWSHDNPYYDLSPQKLFSPQRFISDLGDYLAARESQHDLYLMRGYKTLIYGHAVYEAVQEYLASGKDATSHFRTLNTIHLLYEHKKALLQRLQYVCSLYQLEERLGPLLPHYKKIITHFERLRFLYMNIYFRQQGDLAEVIESLSRVKQLELPLLEQIWLLLQQEQTISR